MKNSVVGWEGCFRVDIASGDNFAKIDVSENNAYDIAILGKLKAISGQGRFGVTGIYVLYGADSIKTAIAEKLHGLRAKKFLQEFGKIGGRYLLVSEISFDREMQFCDIRGLQDKHTELYRDSDYSKSQRFAEEIYKKGEAGIIYDSLRQAEGECLAIFLANDLLDKVDKKNVGKIILSWDGNDFHVIDGKPNQ